MTPQLVHELDLPLLDTIELERGRSAPGHHARPAGRALAGPHPAGVHGSRYEDAVAVLRDRRFHSALSLIPADGRDRPARGVPQESRRPLDPVHGGRRAPPLRRLVAPAFTPAATDRLRPFMREVVSGLVDEVAERGSLRVRGRRSASPTPSPSSASCSARPRRTGSSSRSWATDIFRIFNQDLADDLPAIERASGELEAYVHGHGRGAPPASPGDDLLSTLIAIEEEGDRLSSDELVMLAEAVLWPGTDTTRNQLGCSVALLAEHPDQWALLAERPELAPRAVEESMRYLGAVRGTVRVASEDIEYRDVLFPAGTLVSVALAGANMDSAVFAAPETFDITRRARRPADDLRLGHPLLHGGGPGPGRAAGGAALLARRHARSGAATGRWSGSRPPSASGDRPGSPCASSTEHLSGHIGQLTKSDASVRDWVRRRRMTAVNEAIEFDTTDVDRHIGKPVGGGQLKEPVTVTDIRRWVQGMQYPNPLHYDDDTPPGRLRAHRGPAVLHHLLRRRARRGPGHRGQHPRHPHDLRRRRVVVRRSRASIPVTT